MMAEISEELLTEIFLRARTLGWVKRRGPMCIEDQLDEAVGWMSDQIEKRVEFERMQYAAGTEETRLHD